MKTYFISYDLSSAPGADYARLHTRIQAFIQWARPLESVWIIKSSMSSSQIRDALIPFLVPRGRLFVVEAAPLTWAGWGLDHRVVAWLNENAV